MFKKTQECLREWDLNPGDKELRDAYFESVHALLLTPAFVRMQKNPYTLDWNSARRTEDRLTFNPILKAFYATHLQLSKLVHNSVPHYLQVGFAVS